jgi:RNA polymerase II elongation factor ELL
MPFDTAIRKPLVHYLAVRPREYLKCHRAVHTNPRRILEKVARKTGKGKEEWALLDRAYKELDVWTFNYSEKDRQAAIENAIHAYDRIRLPKDDPHWQKLLPEEERGKGKVLSRLAFKDTAKGSPALKAQAFDRKTGLPKRKEPKKTEKDSAKAKKAKDGTAEEKPRAMKSAAEARTPKVEPRKERQPTKRTTATTDDGRSPSRKHAKPSTAAKGFLNKPKNLSPLGVPPVNASDFEDGHPVHKRLSAATSPRAGTKRKSDEINGSSHNVHGVSKRPHLDFTSSSSSEERPLKAAKATTTSRTNGINSRANGHISPDSDSSSTSQPLALSWRQSLEMARKFNIYYQRYKKLYMELSQSAEPPSEKKREELLEMHRRLERMKKEVNNGAL